MKQGKQLWQHGCRLGLMTALLMMGTSITFAGDAPSKKLVKQISHFETTVNRMLVDSGNFLVANRNPAGGLYVPGYGVVVTFNASVMDRDFKFDLSKFMDKFHIEREGGKVIVHIEEWDDEEKARVREDLRQAAEDVKRATEDIRKAARAAKLEAEEMRAEMDEGRAERYEDGKEEVVDILLDYGETFGRLQDSEHVMVAVFLSTNKWFGDRSGLEKLVVSASMGDLRAYAQGRINEDTMRQRIDILEY